MGGGVTTPPLWLLGELLVFVVVSVFVLQMPRRCGQLVIGNTWVGYYKSTAHGFHGRFGEREIAWNLAPYCSSCAMIIAPYLLRYNIPSTALACTHTLQPY